MGKPARNSRAAKGKINRDRLGSSQIGIDNNINSSTAINGVIACIATKFIIGAITKHAVIPGRTENPIDAGKAVIATAGRSGTTRRQINRDPSGGTKQRPKHYEIGASAAVNRIIASAAKKDIKSSVS